MRLSYRHRAGLLLTGLVLAAPLFASSAVAAGPTTITFTGTPPLGISTLACPSTPSRASLTVAAGATVDFVNRTGRPGTLWAGDSQKVLPDQSLVPVTFGSGPAKVVVQLVPQCSLDLGKHQSMTVTVQAAGASPGATPTAIGSPDPTSAPGSGSGSTAIPRSGATSAPDHPSPVATPSSDASSSPAAAATASSGGDGSDNNPFAPPPPGADSAKNAVIGTVAGPQQPRSASGLLTLIATVGVVGVAAAAIRAILAQRANRALSV
jgi:hypothetical protein